jgi:flagellar motor switch protein FliM
MPEPNGTLSQWEIDNLLNQIPDTRNASDPDDVGVPQTLITQRERAELSRIIKTYDFRRPDKFSKEQWQTLTAMHETFARMVGSQFSSRMRTLVTVRLSSIDQGLYEEWQLQLPSETACYVFSMPPLSGSLVVEISHDVAGEVVDRLLGGNALMPARDRELSDIEAILLRSFSRSIASALQEMWINVIPIEPDVQELGFDASLIQVAGANDVVVTAFFEVNLGNRLGSMSMCIPYTVLEQIASKLNAQVWLSHGALAGTDTRTRRAVRTVLGTAPLDLTVELGTAEVPARSIVELREGDTLLLDARVDRPLPVMVGGARRFVGRPGMVGNRVALRVSDVSAPLTLSDDDGTEAQSHSDLGGTVLHPAPTVAVQPAQLDEEIRGAA